MPTYVTKIRKPSGETEEQLLTVPQESQLTEYLSRVDGFVVDCVPYNNQTVETKRPEPTLGVAPALLKDKELQRLRSKPQEVVVFCWFLFTLVHGGVPLTRALHIVQSQMDSEAWLKVIKGLITSLEKGLSFADSLKLFPRFFPASFVHMIDVGEMSGNLDRVLETLAETCEKQVENRSKLKSVMIYPAVLLTACGGVIFFMLAFVLPRIVKMFDRQGLDLPMITRVLMFVGETLRYSLPLLVIVGAGIVFAYHSARKTRGGQLFLGRLYLNLPLFGGLYRKLIFSRYCQNLALMQASGVPLLICLEMSRDGLGNRVLDDFFRKVEASLREGAALGEELARCPYIPKMVSSMVSVGEETGRLSEMLGNVSRFYDRDIEQTVKTLPKILEPTLIVIMTLVVGVIAASVFLPLAALTKGIG